MINVTQTYLPSIDVFTNYLKRIWHTKQITNRGELTLKLEDDLKCFLNVSNVILMTNGTIPIQIALKLLANGGQVITTPFSYIATSSAIIWENCTPVFVDIDPEFWTIDERKIEESITQDTKAILATHIFGNPCNIEKIDAIAKKNNIKVIYDAAHCFGVTYKSKSIFSYGDISTCSFHATKIFHTGEGGALFSESSEIIHKAFYSHNFGHNGPLNFHGLGINGKISELQAAMGLSVLPNFPEILKARKQIVNLYLDKLQSPLLTHLKLREGTEWNYSYFPVLFPKEEVLLKVQEALNQEGIFPRRYFYPSLNRVEFIQGMEMPISENISSRILCLPLYYGLEDKILQKICKIINLQIAN